MMTLISIAVPVLFVVLFIISVVFDFTSENGGGYDYYKDRGYDPLDPFDPRNPNNTCSNCGSSDTDGSHCFRCGHDF